MRAPGPRGPARTLSAADGLLYDLCPTLDRLASDYGRTFRLRVGPQTFLIVGEAQYVGDVVDADPAQYRWRPAFRSFSVALGSTAIIMSDGDAHQARRRTVQPFFARRRVDAGIPIMLEEADRVIDALSIGTTIDLAPRLRDATRRITFRMLFSEDISTHADDLGDRLEPAVRYCNDPLPSQLPHPFPGTRRAWARAARADADRVLDTLIATRQGSPREEHDLLDALLAKAIPPAELRDQIVAMAVAGYEPTSAALAWTMTRATARNDVWKRLRSEADHSLAPADLTFPLAVVRESLRLHPPGAVVPRRVVVSTRIGPYAVPRWDDGLVFAVPART